MHINYHEIRVMYAHMRNPCCLESRAHSVVCNDSKTASVFSSDSSFSAAVHTLENLGASVRLARGQLFMCTALKGVIDASIVCGDVLCSLFQPRYQSWLSCACTLIFLLQLKCAEHSAGRSGKQALLLYLLLIHLPCLKRQHLHCCSREHQPHHSCHDQQHSEEMFVPTASTIQ